MLKRLRAKFIALNMATVAVVLVAALGGICAITWQQSNAQVDSALEGALDGAVQAADHAAKPAGAGHGPQPDAPDQDPTFEPPKIGGMSSRDLIPVAAYAFTEQGALEAAGAPSNAALSDDALAQAAQALANAPDGHGTLDGLGLIYAKRTAGNQQFAAFADASSADGWKPVAATLAGAGVAALAVLFGVNMLFSRWALRPVETAWNAQRQFVADASHELKTPLTVILANASILLKAPGKTVQDQRQWVESTQTEAETMQGLVEDMLNLARLDSGAAPVKELVDLAEVVERKTLQFESVAFEHDVDLNAEVEPGIRVRGSAPQLERLCATLLDNACKYAGAGGKVDVYLSRCGHHAQLRVSNTGACLTPEELPHVFDRFWRADQARVREGGGFGLGLAIAKSIAEEHRGAITAASSPDTGTAFTVKIPLAK